MLCQFFSNLTHSVQGKPATEKINESGSVSTYNSKKLQTNQTCKFSEKSQIVTNTGMVIYTENMPRINV